MKLRVLDPPDIKNKDLKDWLSAVSGIVSSSSEIFKASQVSDTASETGAQTLSNKTWSSTTISGTTVLPSCAFTSTTITDPFINFSVSGTSLSLLSSGGYADPGIILTPLKLQALVSTAIRLKPATTVGDTLQLRIFSSGSWDASSVNPAPTTNQVARDISIMIGFFGAIRNDANTRAHPLALGPDPFGVAKFAGRAINGSASPTSGLQRPGDPTVQTDDLPTINGDDTFDFVPGYSLNGFNRAYSAELIINNT